MKHNIMMLAKGLWGHVTGTERLADEATPAQRTEFENRGTELSPPLLWL